MHSNARNIFRQWPGLLEHFPLAVVTVSVLELVFYICVLWLECSNDFLPFHHVVSLCLDNQPNSMKDETLCKSVNIKTSLNKLGKFQTVTWHNLLVPNKGVLHYDAPQCMGCHTQFWFGRRKHHCRWQYPDLTMQKQTLLFNLTSILQILWSSLLLRVLWAGSANPHWTALSTW